MADTVFLSSNASLQSSVIFSSAMQQECPFKKLESELSWIQRKGELIVKCYRQTLQHQEVESDEESEM